MLPDVTLPVPGSLMSLLAVFAPLFTTPSFRTFCGLACGFLAQTGKRTVCGMLTGAGLARLWPHDRAHWFFTRARWSADDLGLAVALLVVTLLVPAGHPVLVAVDDMLTIQGSERNHRAFAGSWLAAHASPHARPVRSASRPTHAMPACYARSSRGSQSSIAAPAMSTGSSSLCSSGCSTLSWPSAMTASPGWSPAHM
jgi:DDE superfamily endonuclease